MEANTLELPTLLATLQEYGQALKDTYKSQITSKGHDASTVLNKSVQFRVDVKNGSMAKAYSVSIIMADYWKWLEYGRGPGKFPPPNKIADWIRIKPVIPYPDSRGKLPSVNQLTYLISRKIAHEGTPRTDLLKKSVEEINAEYLPKIREAFRKDAQNSLALVIKELF